MNREQVCKKWLASHISGDFEVSPIHGDASFRQYFRVHTSERSYILVDAPPEYENSHRFIELAHIFRDHDVIVPHIEAYQLDQGWMLVSDFGDTMLADCLHGQSTDALYHLAIDECLKFQTAHMESKHVFPYFDENQLVKEWQLFTHWFLGKHLQMVLSPADTALLNGVFEKLKENFIAQPQVVVHRDYHSRNLMVINGHLGIIDFQDACVGPLMYDLASLLKDAYVDWPKSQRQVWLDYYIQSAKSVGLVQAPTSTIQRWFDITGLQRHLKIMGIFSRLCYRDNKPQFLTSFPRLYHYIQEVTQQYPAWAELHDWCDQHIGPRL